MNRFWGYLAILIGSLWVIAISAVLMKEGIMSGAVIGDLIFYHLLIGIPGYFIVRRLLIKVARRKQSNKEYSNQNQGS